METKDDQVLDSPSKNSYIGSYYQPSDKVLSVSRQLDFLTQSPAIMDPRMSIHSPNLDSQAVVTALKTLQEKIRKLEVERKQAEMNYRQFSLDSQKYQQAAAAGNTTLTSLSEAENSNKKAELDSKMRLAEARCQILEKQLDYMRGMVERAVKERNTPKKKQTSVLQRTNSSSSSSSQAQREKLEKLESECLKLRKTQTAAEAKLAILEKKLLEEEHERKLVQEKAEELQREFDVSLRLSAKTQTEETKPKKMETTKKTAKQSELATGSPKQNKFPFVAGKSTSPSHSVHANIQSVLHMMKHHQPQFYERVSSLQRSTAKRNLQKNFPSSVGKPESSSADQQLGSLSDLLLALQDELGQMSFEHQELVHQMEAAEHRDERRDLEKELERLVTRMDEKGAQITKLRKHQQTIQKMTGGIKPRAPSPVVDKQRPKKDTIQTNLQLLRGTQKLQSSLKQDDLYWET
ncbi:unnamed protein product [Ophioblennius macclurei]